MHEPLDFSLVIPTYNERENLPELCARLGKILQGRRFEVIVVDDNSSDGTGRAAEKLRASYDWLRVIRREGERGLSSAVVTGFRAARGRVLGVMDADLQHDETRWPQLLAAMQYADFAVGTRRAAGGSLGCWSWLRRLTSWAATELARGIAPVPLSDPMSGFFAMRRRIFAAMDDGSLEPKGYKILLYLYARALRQFSREGLRVREVGYEFRLRERGTSKLSSRVMMQYLCMVLELHFQLRLRSPRPRFIPAAS